MKASVIYLLLKQLNVWPLCKMYTGVSTRITSSQVYFRAIGKYLESLFSSSSSSSSRVVKTYLTLSNSLQHNRIKTKCFPPNKSSWKQIKWKRVKWEEQNVHNYEYVPKRSKTRKGVRVNNLPRSMQTGVGYFITMCWNWRFIYLWPADDTYLLH